MSTPGTDWRKAGRDAAHEDATYEDAVPCTTLDGASERCAAWLEDAEAADVEAAAAGYLAGWTAHLRDADDTSAPPLDLDAIEARANAAYPPPWRAGVMENEGKVWARDPDALGGPSVGERCLFIANKHYPHTANREFIAHARTDVPALIARGRDLTAANERLRGAARAVIDGFLAMRDDIRTDADEAARVANAERLRDAFRVLVEEVSK